jgi:tetratricopeptide (TPR) repeat protein
MMMRIDGMRFTNRFSSYGAVVAALLILTATAVSSVTAQVVGGDLGGGADIFRPKNPTIKRRTTGNRPPPRPRPNRTPVMTPEDRAEKYEEALDDGNKARDERRYADAEKAYRSAAQLLPRDVRAPYGLGNIFVDQQRWDDAEASYRSAMSFGAPTGDILVALSFVLVQPHAGGTIAARLAEAERLAKRGTEVDPGNPLGYDRLGAAREARGLLDAETEQAYRKAVELDPQYAVGEAHLAGLLRRTNRAPEAESHYQRAIELAKDAQTLVLVADGLQAGFQYDKSKPLLRHAIELDAKYPPAYYLLAKALLIERDFAGTEDVIKQGLAVSPHSYQLTFLMGRNYFLAEKLPDAERTFISAAELAPISERKQVAGDAGLSGVGDAYLHQGNAKDAVRVYQKAAEIDPANTTLASKIADAKARAN